MDIIQGFPSFFPSNEVASWSDPPGHLHLCCYALCVTMANEVVHGVSSRTCNEVAPFVTLGLQGTFSSAAMLCVVA